MDTDMLRWTEDPPRSPLVYGRLPIESAAWPSRMGDTKLLYLLTLACVRHYDVRITVDVIGGVAGVFTGQIESVSLRRSHGDLIWCDGAWRTTRSPRMDDGAMKDGPYHASLHIAYVTEIELIAAPVDAGSTPGEE